MSARQPKTFLTLSAAIVAGALTVAFAGRSPHQTPPSPTPPQQPPASQQREIAVTLTGEGGAPPRLAVPDFIALSPDAETAAVARMIGQVLWDDFNFEREFALIPRDTYATIPRATSFADVPFARWRELNADGFGSRGDTRSGAS